MVWHKSEQDHKLKQESKGDSSRICLQRDLVWFGRKKNRIPSMRERFPTCLLLGSVTWGEQGEGRHPERFKIEFGHFMNEVMCHSSLPKLLHRL